MTDLLGVLLPILFILIPFGILFYFKRKERRKTESRLTPDEKNKKFTKEISSIIAILLGLVAKNITDSWLIGGIVAGTAEIILLKYFTGKNK